MLQISVEIIEHQIGEQGAQGGALRQARAKKSSMSDS
jgi:hypothetical protein